MQTAMNVVAVAVAVCGCLSLGSAQVPGFGSCPGTQAQSSLNITRYLGLWYEQYHFPAIFEWGQTCVTANYTLKDDGHINVDNMGYKSGEYVQAVGDAYRPDDSKPGQLEVKFAEGAPYGNYWVIETDYDDYTVVFSCGPLLGLAHVEFAWILSRRPQLDEVTVQRLMTLLKDGGVNTGNFRKSSQDSCPDRP